MTNSKNWLPHPLMKIIYFDKESAAEYLDFAAISGGKVAQSTGEKSPETPEAAKPGAKSGSKPDPKAGWIPFLGASADRGTPIHPGATGRSFLSKNRSSNIVVDYLEAAEADSRIVKLTGLTVTAPTHALAHSKSFAAYLKRLNVSAYPEAAAHTTEIFAGGYYELLGSKDDEITCVLRFNGEAFRNNYGLTDVGLMRLVFHGIQVGETIPTGLDATNPTVPVYDVLFAGVEHAIYGE